jgi:hypothetical protein
MQSTELRNLSVGDYRLYRVGKAFGRVVREGINQFSPAENPIFDLTKLPLFIAGMIILPEIQEFMWSKLGIDKDFLFPHTFLETLFSRIFLGFGAFCIPPMLIKAARELPNMLNDIREFREEV